MNSSWLLIGNQETNYKRVLYHMQQKVCGRLDGCGLCQQIEEGTYYGIVWLKPSKNNYTLGDLHQLNQLVSLKKDETENWFIVIDEAERLSNACANSILKLLEEPPLSFTFFLLSKSLKELLPTIVSRCIIETQTVTSESAYEKLEEALCNPTLTNFEFNKLLEHETPAEHETAGLLEKIIREMKEKRPELAQKLASYYIQLPMPGSAKHFWRMIYLLCKNKEVR